MQIIPAVDVLEGSVVRLMRGEYDAVTTYGDDPAATLTGWGEMGAPIVHVVDLTGAKTGEPDAALRRRLSSAGVPYQLGGGIRDVATAAAVVAAGAQRVVLGTAAVWSPGVLTDVVREVGADSVVAALDVRAGKATGAGWLDEGKPLPEVVAGVVDAGVRHVLVTGISRDGTMEGPDLEVVRDVMEAGPALEVIGSGGVGTLDDLAALAAVGVTASIVGRALYENRFTYEEAVTAALR